MGTPILRILVATAITSFLVSCSSKKGPVEITTFEEVNIDFCDPTYLKSLGLSDDRIREELERCKESERLKEELSEFKLKFKKKQRTFKRESEERSEQEIKQTIHELGYNNDVSLGEEEIQKITNSLKREKEKRDDLFNQLANDIESKFSSLVENRKKTLDKMNKVKSELIRLGVRPQAIYKRSEQSESSQGSYETQTGQEESESGNGKSSAQKTEENNTSTSKNKESKENKEIYKKKETSSTSESSTSSSTYESHSSNEGKSESHSSSSSRETHSSEKTVTETPTSSSSSSSETHTSSSSGNYEKEKKVSALLGQYHGYNEELLRLATEIVANKKKYFWLMNPLSIVVGNSIETKLKQNQLILKSELKNRDEVKSILEEMYKKNKNEIVLETVSIQNLNLINELHYKRKKILHRGFDQKIQLKLRYIDNNELKNLVSFLANMEDSTIVGLSLNGVEMKSSYFIALTSLIERNNQNSGDVIDVAFNAEGGHKLIKLNKELNSHNEISLGGLSPSEINEKISVIRDVMGNLKEKSSKGYNSEDDYLSAAVNIIASMRPPVMMRSSSGPSSISDKEIQLKNKAPIQVYGLSDAKPYRAKLIKVPLDESADTYFESVKKAKRALLDEREDLVELEKIVLAELKINPSTVDKAILFLQNVVLDVDMDVKKRELKNLLRNIQIVMRANIRSENILQNELGPFNYYHRGNANDKRKNLYILMHRLAWGKFIKAAKDNFKGIKDSEKKRSKILLGLPKNMAVSFPAVITASSAGVLRNLPLIGEPIGKHFEDKSVEYLTLVAGWDKREAKKLVETESLIGETTAAVILIVTPAAAAKADKMASAVESIDGYYKTVMVIKKTTELLNQNLGNFKAVSSAIQGALHKSNDFEEFIKNFKSEIRIALTADAANELLNGILGNPLDALSNQFEDYKEMKKAAKDGDFEKVQRIRSKLSTEKKFQRDAGLIKFSKDTKRAGRSTKMSHKLFQLIAQTFVCESFAVMMENLYQNDFDFQKTSKHFEKNWKKELSGVITGTATKVLEEAVVIIWIGNKGPGTVKSKLKAQIVRSVFILIKENIVKKL